MRRRSRGGALVLIALGLGLLTWVTWRDRLLTALPDGDATSDNTVATTPEARRHAERPERLRRSIWWNQQPMIAELALTSDQRQAMDLVLGEIIEPRRQLLAARRQAHDRFTKSLLTGDRANARRAADAQTRAEADLLRLDSQFRRSVLRRLTPDQRRHVAERIPSLLTAPWLQGGAGTSSFP